MVDQRDSLAREIDEELRREQLLKLWEQYGTYVIAAAVLIIAGIGGYKYLRASPRLGGRGGRRPLRRPRHARRRRTRRPRRRRRWRSIASERARRLCRAGAPAAGCRASARPARRREAAAAFEAIAKESGRRSPARRLCPAAGGHVETGQRQLDGHAESAQRSGSGWQCVAFQRPGAARAGGAEGRQDRRGAHASSSDSWAIATRRRASPSGPASCWPC